MIPYKTRLQSIAQLGTRLSSMLTADSDKLTKLIEPVYSANNWFTRENIIFSLNHWSKLLTKESMEQWLEKYDLVNDHSNRAYTIGVINAGNIPLAGMHDFLSVIVSGNHYTGKNSKEDELLLPAIADLLFEIEPAFKGSVSFTDKIKEADAVIATGSNNTARYFEYYFSSIPNIIRKNRNGVAVLTGQESSVELERLAQDIFLYFGLGCRNVSKLYVPVGYPFDSFFSSILSFSNLMEHHRYMNNFDYHNALLLLKKITFLQNGFLILREEIEIASPVAVVHYSYYNSLSELTAMLEQNENQIQCIVSNQTDLPGLMRQRMVPFGHAQQPGLSDYADGVDTMQFLQNLNSVKA